MGEKIIQPPFYNSGFYDTGAGGGGGVSDIDFIQIKDNYYPFRKIGNKYYTLRNLLENFDGVNEGFTYGPYSVYYHNKNIYGKYYSMDAVPLVDNWVQNNTDWRVTTKDDIDYLINNNTFFDICDIATWLKNNTNKTQFSLLSSGYSNAGSIEQAGGNGYLITSTIENGKNYYMIAIGANTSLSCTNQYSVNVNAWPIRLCKDA
jgi:hypothetical protein